MKKKPEKIKSKGVRVQGWIATYYYKKMNELIREGRFRGESNFIDFCIRFYVDWLERRDFNYAQEIPDELGEKEGKP